MNVRYYRVLPEEKSLKQCAAHGVAHCVYGWVRQVDPRWTEEQVTAYTDAYLAQLRVEAAAGCMRSARDIEYVTNNSVYEENIDNETKA